MTKTTRFVIHDHFSKGGSGHHWDLRIYYQGKLKSWAIPKHKLPEKGKPSLAVQVNDHPLSYYNFTGIIKDGYGRGKVDIYDKGVCILLEWKPNKIGVLYKGSKIRGTYWLIRTKRDPKMWVWVKGK